MRERRAVAAGFVLLSEMREPKMEPIVIASDNAGVSACEKAGQRSEALSLLGGIGEAKPETEDISHNGSIRSCEKGGQWFEASPLARETGEGSLETDVISYAASLGACENGGHRCQYRPV